MPAGISPKAPPWGAVAALTKAGPQPAACQMAAQPPPPWFCVCLSLPPTVLPLTPLLFLFFSFVPSLCSSSGLFWGISLCWELAWGPPHCPPPSSPRTLPLSLCTLTPARNVPEQPWRKDGLASACLSFSLSVHVEPPWKCQLGHTGVTCSGTGTDLAVLCSMSGKAALGQPGSAPSPAHPRAPELFLPCWHLPGARLLRRLDTVPCACWFGLRRVCFACPLLGDRNHPPALPQEALPGPAGAGSSWSVFYRIDPTVWSRTLLSPNSLPAPVPESPQ